MSSPQAGKPSDPWSRNRVLHAKAREHYWEGEAALSIKSFRGGGALYDVGRGRHAVDDNSYLILNQGRHYSIAIEALRPVESFCLFFAPGLAEDVCRNLNNKTSSLLDEPWGAPSGPIQFYEKTYPHDEILSPAIRQLHASMARGERDPHWLTEQMHELMRRLLLVHRNARAEAEALPAVRAATRDELYRRLHRARDFIAASLDRPLSLDEMALACLSPNHFLRTFKELFHRSPRQYLTALRLEQAKRLLGQSGVSVTEACFAVGFESLGSFSSLFRRKVGLSPEAFRRLGSKR